MEDLAELSVDELTEKGKIEDEERAAALIMTARKPWFEEAGNNNEVSLMADVTVDRFAESVGISVARLKNSSGGGISAKKPKIH